MAIVSNNVVVGDNQKMTVSSGAEAYDTIVSAGYNNAYQNVLEGGSAIRTEVKKGTLNVSAGAYANSALINGSRAEMYVYANGSANNTTVKNNGVMYISAGGKATNVNIDSTGRMEIDVTSNTVLTGTSHGKAVSVGNGVTSNVTIYDLNYMNVASNWTAYDTVLSAGYNHARQNVLEGGSAVRTEV